jgi:hypothetical protein
MRRTFFLTFPQISGLSLCPTGCRNVTDNGLTALATLLKLEKLTISYLDRITDSALQDICGLKELECRRCPFISDHGVSVLIKSSPQLRLLDLSRCDSVTSTVLQVAKDACNNRSNNTMLKLIIGGSSIFPQNETGDDKPSPLLQIVNVDLSNFLVCTPSFPDDDDDDNDDEDDEDDDDDDDDYYDDDYYDDDDNDDADYWLGENSDNSDLLHSDFENYPPVHNKRYYEDLDCLSNNSDF